MSTFLKTLKKYKALIVLLSVPFFYSCSSYKTTMDVYYNHLTAKQYDKALKNIESNKYLHKKRNQLLLNLEAGRVSMLMNDVQKSNEYLNAADALLESNYRTAKDVVVNNLINPMQETYRGETFEKLMIHYFKSLNYAAVNNIDDAVVEARRITLATNRQKEKFNDKANRYSKDPFILNIQGMLYEMSGDWNNAFISYREAVDVYLAANLKKYYGVLIPNQLQQDLLYSASVMGFTEDQKKYEALFGEELSRKKNSAGEIILFLEEGHAPVKIENSVTISNLDGNGSFQYYDQYGSYISVPFDHRSYGISNEKLSSFRTFKIALPAYQVRDASYSHSSIFLNDVEFHPELSEDFNTLAVSVLNERMPQELAKAVARFLIKKTVEVGAEKVTQQLAEKKSNETESERKQREKAENIGKAVGFLVNIANTVSEKADTRCWLSLPAFISYVRIPLQPGENKISINYKHFKKEILVDGNGGLQLKSVVLD